MRLHQELLSTLFIIKLIIMTKVLLSIVILSIMAAAGNAQNTFRSIGAAGVDTTMPDASSLEIKC